MRRRIERSRARCERQAPPAQTEKPKTAEQRTQLEEAEARSAPQPAQTTAS
jgi:hypothetical protein